MLYDLIIVRYNIINYDIVDTNGLNPFQIIICCVIIIIVGPMKCKLRNPSLSRILLCSHLVFIVNEKNNC